MQNSAALLPTVLTIAGSDPSGGAGIQADLKTMNAIGVYGAAAITCITVQNSRGVTRSVALAPELVVEQVRAVLADHRVTHIKIGMVGDLGIASALTDLLAHFPGEVVYDSVLASTTGQSLLNSDRLDGLDGLLNQVTTLTPNSLELGQFSRQTITTPEQALTAAQGLLARFPKLRCLIIKGGHLNPTDPDVCDLLVRRGQEPLRSVRPRAASVHLHGTGCTFASAFASYHCLLGDDAQTFFRACSFMDTLINRSAPLSTVNSLSNGPLLHFLLCNHPVEPPQHDLSLPGILF